MDERHTIDADTFDKAKALLKPLRGHEGCKLMGDGSGNIWAEHVPGCEAYTGKPIMPFNYHMRTPVSDAHHPACTYRDCHSECPWYNGGPVVADGKWHPANVGVFEVGIHDPDDPIIREAVTALPIERFSDRFPSELPTFILDKTKYRIRFEDETEESVKVIIERKQ